MNATSMWPQSNFLAIHSTAVISHSRSFILALTSGALCGVGFLATQLWPLVFVGIVPLLLAATNTHISRRSVFLYGWIAGSVLYGLATYAIFWHTLPIDWLGAFPASIQIFLVGFSWAVPVIGMGLATGIFALVVRTLHTDRWHDVALIVALWTLAESAAAILFSVVTLGEGSFVHTHFTLGFLGYLVAHSPVFIQGAAYGGVYILSALAALVSAIIWRVIRLQVSRENPGKYIIVAAISLGAVITLHTYAKILIPSEKGGESIRVAVISLHENPTLSSSSVDDRASAAAIESLLPKARGVDLIVLPESSGFFRTRPMLLPDASLWAMVPHSVTIDSDSVYNQRGALMAQLAYHTDTGQTPIFSHKQFLLPDGEYIPYLFSIVVRAIGYGDELTTLAKHRLFLPGEPSKPVTVAGAPIATLFCNEAMSPFLYRTQVRRGASVLVNIASQSWFHSSRAVAQQMETITRVRAVESRRWYVQSNNLAPALVINPYGTPVARTTGTREEIIISDVFPRKDHTPYVRFGPLILYLSFAVLAVYSALTYSAKMIRLSA